MSGESTSELRTVTIVGSHPPILDMHVRVVTEDGETVSSLKIGERFFVEVAASAVEDSGILRPFEANVDFDFGVAGPVGDVESNGRFSAVKLDVVTPSDGSRSLESHTIPPSSTVYDDSIHVNVPGFRLQEVFATETQIFRVPFIARAAGEAEFHVTDFAVSLDSHLINLASAAVSVRPGSAWQNAAMPLDVNNDGMLSPLDALVGINRLNAAEDRTLPAQRSSTNSSDPFPDTNGDGYLSPLDVMLVINGLNGAYIGEGESAPVSRRLARASVPAGETTVAGLHQRLKAQIVPPLDTSLDVSENTIRSCWESLEDDPSDLLAWSVDEDLIAIG